MDTGKSREASVAYSALRIIVACNPKRQPDNIINITPERVVWLKGITAISNSKVMGSPIIPILRG